jgi:hypothetical protein
MWPFRRKHSRTSAATLARIRAERELERTRQETPLYRELAESLRELRERNNFAAAIETSFRGGRP